ncbi:MULTISPECIES: hypothetical protein [Bacillus]|uniref:hypothetical protein n=1 Tax=Bacillus TaxID=1386 RepID=UPI000992C3FF|nr:hypothetical protein [Bacillus pseudomycoides]MED4714411.1 hypothetical protein [Bacillus pseudomycoides]OOR48010.1 hypothetical protein BLX05_30190 [Bacillus pseudomycoides]
MSYYQMLYSTPYLYSSKSLRQMYRDTKREEDISAIREHMVRHEVYLDRQYKGYYYLSQKIEEDLYGDEYLVSWNELLDDYQLYSDSNGKLSIKRKGRE